MKPMPQFDREDGFSMYIVVMVMMVLLTLGAALSAAGHQSSTGINADEAGVRALQAAESGAQAAVHRLNLQQPTDDKCITTSESSPQAGNSWCAQTTAESVGNGSSYRYQTSLPLTNGCTGGDFGNSTVQRCVVSVGTAGGVTRRVVQRVVSSSGTNPFPTAGVIGKDFIEMKNNDTLVAGLGTNGQLELGSNAVVNGTVQLWSGAPNPIGYSGPVQRNPQPFVFSPPNMLNPETHLDSNASNDNGRLLANASPADSCSGGNGQGNTCYTSGGASPRTLSLGNQGSVTLGGGTYNFCQISLGNGAAVNIAAEAKILIYLDSPSRPGSGCVTGQGGITSGNNAIFSNPSGDPRALQLVVYGSPSFPVIYIPNNLTMAAAIYAPNTGIEFKNNGAYNGGITAKSVKFKNNAVSWDSRLNDYHLATTLVYYRGSWRQCNSRVQSTSAPATGCL